MSNEKKDDTGPDSQLEAQARGARHYFTSGAFSDLLISCKGDEWKVHKLQVCAQSEFFHKMCSGAFREAKESKIHLDNDEPQVVEAMLHYMYYGTYSDPGNAPAGFAPILLDVKMFIIADKYFIKLLKAVAREKFEQHCANNWDTDNFALAVREIYGTQLGDTSVKDIAIKTITKHASRFLTETNTYEEINNAIRDLPVLGADILVELAASYDFDAGACRNAVKSETQYKWTFKYPACPCTFTMIIPLGEAIQFGCPQNHHRNSFSWWTRHKI